MSWPMNLANWSSSFTLTFIIWPSVTARFLSCVDVPVSGLLVLLNPTCFLKQSQPCRWDSEVSLAKPCSLLSENPIFFSLLFKEKFQDSVIFLGEQELFVLFFCLALMCKSLSGMSFWTILSVSQHHYWCVYANHQAGVEHWCEAPDCCTVSSLLINLNVSMQTCADNIFVPYTPFVHKAPGDEESTSVVWALLHFCSWLM